MSGFSTARLVAAPLELADAEELAALDDARLHAFTGDQPLDAEQWRDRARRLAAAARRTQGDRWLTWTLRLRDGGEVAGFVQATVSAATPASAELAWVVGAAHQGRGLATEAADGMVRWLAGEGVTELTAAIAPGHLASERVAAHLGLGVSGEVRDAERLWRGHRMCRPSEGQDSAMSGIPVDPEPAPRQVVRAGPWAVANRDGEYHAVSRLCHHQFGDLSKGRIDAQGCLVCPWHAAAYRLDDGAMVRGPRGFLGLHRRLPGYERLVLAYSRYWPLRRRAVARDEHGRLSVQ